MTTIVGTLSPIQRGVRINARRVEGVAIDRPAILHASIRKVEESCRRGILLIERFKIAQSLGNAAVIEDNIVSSQYACERRSRERYALRCSPAGGRWVLETFHRVPRLPCAGPIVSSRLRRRLEAHTGPPRRPQPKPSEPTTA